MLNLLHEIARTAAQALTAALPEKADAVPAELPVQPAARPEFGDFQIAACLQLARPLGRKPRELAALVQTALAAHPALEKAEIAGPGYVNLFLRTAWLEERVTALHGDPELGLRKALFGQCVVIDFSSPNIAKPMMIGHIRSTLIGDCLQRVLRALGARVIADNHLGDWGTPFGKLIVAYRRWLDREAYARDPIGELVRLYQKFAREDQGAAARDEEEDEGAERGASPLLLQARAELAKLQQGDPQNLALWREFVAVSMDTFARSYQRLGVHFDVQHGESFYHDRLPALVEELLREGIAEISQGAVICPVEGAPAPLLIRKVDGSYLYGTTDLATIEYRVKTWHPARILYVVGAPQQLHFQQLFAVARKMGVSCELEHVYFGSIRARNPETGKWEMMRTRAGTSSLLEDFLDQAVERAAGVAREKNPELGEAELQEVARVVGLGAVKYNDLSRDRVGDINFDLDKALNLEGNTAPYMQYAYARLRSIVHKVMEKEPGPAAGAANPAIRLGLPAERALVRRLLEYPAAVEAVARTCKPHLLAEYLYSLAGAVSTFYNEVPVLRADTAEQRASRVRLIEVVARTLKHGLLLMGIEVLERM